MLLPPYPEHADTVWHLELARSYGLADPRLYSHGQWPGGYPAILRAAVSYGGIHPVTAGRTLSLVSAMVGMFSVCRFAGAVGGRATGVIAAVFLLLNQTFVRMATTEGTDMPAAGLMILSVSWLGTAVSRQRAGTRQAFTSGLLVGAAYMVRFTALVYIPVLALIILLGMRRRGVSLLALCAGFVLSASPQLGSSWVMRGNPFYNELGRNLWLGMYEREGPPATWAEAPVDYTVLDAVRQDSVYYLMHWPMKLGGFLLHGTGWPATINALVILMLCALPVCPIPIWSRVTFIAVPLVPAAVTALTFFLPRYGLVPLMGMSMVAGLGVSWILRKSHSLTEHRPPFRLAMVAGVILLAVAGLLRVTSALSRPEFALAAKRHLVLKDLGVSEVTDLATNDDSLVDMDDPWLKRYCGLQGVWAASGTGALLNRAGTSPFLAIDYRRYFGDFFGVRNDVDAGGSPLAPVYREDSLDVYMVRPEATGAAKVDSAGFALGVSLLGHTWLWREERLVVYLYWTAVQQLGERYVVRVRLVDEEGRQLAAHEGEPELGTYSTMRWEVGKVVVDTHILEPPPTATRGEVEVCLENREDSQLSCRRLWPVHKGGSTPLP
jgi:hypothetical protein